MTIATPDELTRTMLHLFDTVSSSEADLYSFMYEGIQPLVHEYQGLKDCDNISDEAVAKQVLNVAALATIGAYLRVRINDNTLQDFVILKHRMREMLELASDEALKKEETA